jgi:hypothetical protein
MSGNAPLCCRIARLTALSAALVVPSLTSAQNCALCYTQAAGAGSRMIQALRSGILILVFPPMAICIAITIMAYRKRNQFNEDTSLAPVEPADR